MRFILFLLIIILNSNFLYGITKVVIDEFERVNPYTRYRIVTEEESHLYLSISSVAHSGSYSMQMEYSLSTTKPWGCYVGVLMKMKKKVLDWSGVEKIGIWVKGDGSDNIFRISFVDGSDEIWFYEDKNILHSSKWTLLSIPITKFKLFKGGEVNNEVFDINELKEIRFDIIGKTSKTVHGKAAIVSKGAILIDHFYIEGAKLEPELVTLPEEKKYFQIQLGPKANINFNGMIYTEYLNIPYQQNLTYNRNEFASWAKIGINANVERYSAKIIIASEFQRFGESAYRENEFSEYTGQVHPNYPSAVVPFIQFSANKVTPFIGNITVGNLYFTYTPYTFCPTFGYEQEWGWKRVIPEWGYKGISTEGNISVVHYHTFLIKQPYNSFAYGSKISTHFKDVVIGKTKFNVINARLIYVGDRETALCTNDNKIKDVSQDDVYSVDISVRFLNYKLGLEAFCGYNKYKKEAVVDYSDPLNPIYLNRVKNILSVEDPAYKVKIIFDNLLPYLLLTYEYRYLGTEFKPKYRKEPIIFDDIDSDQEGHNIFFIYSLYGFIFSGEFDVLTRLCNSDYFRRRYSGGIETYKIKNLNIFFHYEWRREYYKFVSNRSYYITERDDKINCYEFGVKSQLSSDFDVRFKIRIEDVKWVDEPKQFNTQSLEVKANYYITSSFYCYGEYRTTRMGHPEWFSLGYDPYFDNFLRIAAEFKF